MSTDYDPDPPHKWRRKNYDEAPLRALDYRKDADRRRGSEIETNRDLDKPLEQLVCDVHEETHDPNRIELANIASAQKRMVSMMARVARSNDRLAYWMLILTIAIALMTAVILYLTVVMVKQGGAQRPNQMVQRTGASLSVQETNQPSSAAGSRR